MASVSVSASAPFTGLFWFVQYLMDTISRFGRL